MELVWDVLESSVGDRLSESVELPPSWAWGRAGPSFWLPLLDKYLTNWPPGLCYRNSQHLICGPHMTLT